jgi:hypothetical protein
VDDGLENQRGRKTILGNRPRWDGHYKSPALLLDLFSENVQKSLAGSQRLDGQYLYLHPPMRLTLYACRVARLTLRAVQ